MTMSLLRHNSNYGEVSAKKCVFKWLRKTDSDGTDVTGCGRLFQTQAAATGKVPSPIVDSRVRQIMKLSVSVLDVSQNK